MALRFLLSRLGPVMAGDHLRRHRGRRGQRRAADASSTTPTLVQPSGLVGEIVLPDARSTVPAKQFARSPYAASFTTAKASSSSSRPSTSSGARTWLERIPELTAVRELDACLGRPADGLEPEPAGARRLQHRPHRQRPALQGVVLDRAVPAGRAQRRATHHLLQRQVQELLRPDRVVLRTTKSPTMENILTGCATRASRDPSTSSRSPSRARPRPRCPGASPTTTRSGSSSSSTDRHRQSRCRATRWRSWWG